jgi:hypothetical protein
MFMMQRTADPVHDVYVEHISGAAEEYNIQITEDRKGFTT